MFYSSPYLLSAKSEALCPKLTIQELTGYKKSSSLQVGLVWSDVKAGEDL